MKTALGQRDQVGFGVVILADACLRVGASGVEVAQRHICLLYTSHSADAAKGRRENGQLHGTDSISPTGKQSTGKETVSSPVFFGSFRTVRCVGHGVGRAGVSRR